MKTRVAIYGFGRLGRAIYTIAARRSDLEVVVVVADDTVESIVDALLTDSIYAALEQNVEIADGGFTHNERHITVHKVRKETLWRDHTVDVVIDTVTKNPSVSASKWRHKPDTHNANGLLHIQHMRR